MLYRSSINKGNIMSLLGNNYFMNQLLKEDPMNLQGTKTEQNLRDAFSGESEARNKYTFFASVARKEGYEQIASLFEETAGNEKEHAEIWFKRLNGISNTKDNLRAAASGEHWEWTEMYANFAKDAKDEGFSDLAYLFKKIADIEKRHEKRFLELLNNLETNQVFSKPEKVTWICRNCGHVVESENAPEVCPVCQHSQAYFQVHATNW